MASFRALPLVLRWCVICAAAPSALWVPVAVSVAFIKGLEGAVDAIGSIIIVFICTGLPGAIIGLLAGWLDLTLGQRVARHPHRRRAVAAAAAQMAGTLTLASMLLQLCLSPDAPVLGTLAVSAAFAAVPAVICWRRYAKLSAAPTPDTLPAPPTLR